MVFKKRRDWILVKNSFIGILRFTEKERKIIIRAYLFAAILIILVGYINIYMLKFSKYCPQQFSHLLLYNGAFEKLDFGEVHRPKVTINNA